MGKISKERRLEQESFSNLTELTSPDLLISLENADRKDPRNFKR